MYEQLLFLHSWTRWVVFGTTVYFFLKSTIGWMRGARWTDSDAYFIWVFNQLFGFQLMFGLLLWLSLSPFTKAAFADGSLLSTNAAIFFWVVRHPLTMIFSYGFFHLGRARAKRADAKRKVRIYAVTFGVILFAVCSAIPWPGLLYGRSLFRWFN